MRRWLLLGVWLALGGCGVKGPPLPPVPPSPPAHPAPPPDGGAK